MGHWQRRPPAPISSRRRRTGGAVASEDPKGMADTIIDLDRKEILSLLREVQEMEPGDDLDDELVRWFG
jgi:hypothetical protein